MEHANVGAPRETSASLLWTYLDPRHRLAVALIAPLPS